MKALLLRSTCIAGLLLAANPAWAQDQSTDNSQDENAVNQPARSNEEVGVESTEGEPELVEGGLQDIVVTAQRRTENLQRAAVAVSAVTGDMLEAAGVTRVTELTALVPALQVAPAAGPYNLFYLRGVGNFNANAFSDSAIAFNVDGVYVGRPSSATGFFYDLERIEVLKGPQGTLYGRNATGGAINVITRKPDLGDVAAEASIEYGNYDALRLDGSVNLPLGDIAAVRLAAIHVSRDGHMNDGTDDQDDWGARLSFRVDPTEDLRIVVTGDYFEQGGLGVGATPILAPRGIPAATAFDVDDRIGFFSPQGQAFYTSQRAGTLGRNFYPFPADFAQFQRNDWLGISSTIDWETSVGTLTLIPAYREGHLDYSSYVPGFQVRQIEDSDQTSFEARFATTEDFPLRAIIGAFYFDENTTNPLAAYVSNWNGQFDNSLQLSTESKALFARLTYAITPNVRVNVGGRQTWEDKSFSGQRISLTRLCGLPPIQNCPNAIPLPFGTTPPALTGPGAVLVPQLGPAPYGGFVNVMTNPGFAQSAVVINQDEQAEFDKFTWRAGADWDITPENLLYVSYETGFKSGGFFFSPGVGEFQPESIEAYTLGSKNRFLNNMLQVNLELFHWKYKDQQISHLISISGVPTFATENVGRATFQGFEIEAKAAPTGTTTLTANLQYLDAVYDEFIYTQANTNGGVFNGTSCPNISVSPAGYVVNCSGNRPPNAPEWTLNLGFQQEIPVSFGEFVIDARTHYQTESLVGLEFLPIEYNDDYWLADASVTFYAPERRFYIGAFINNIFDETIKSQMFPTPGTNFFSTTLRPPQTYGLRAGVNF